MQTPPFFAPAPSLPAPDNSRYIQIGYKLGFEEGRIYERQYGINGNKWNHNQPIGFPPIQPPHNQMPPLPIPLPTAMPAMPPIPIPNTYVAPAGPAINSFVAAAVTPVATPPVGTTVTPPVAATVTSAVSQTANAIAVPIEPSIWTDCSVSRMEFQRVLLIILINKKCNRTALSAFVVLSVSKLFAKIWSVLAEHYVLVRGKSTKRDYYIVNKILYSDFEEDTAHQNWENICNSLVKIFQCPKVHFCGTNKCINYPNCKDGEKCRCDTCLNCPFLTGLFSLSPTKFIKKISCKNNNALYPNLKCFRSECKNNDCGHLYLKQFINGQFCSKLIIPDTADIQYNIHKKYSNSNNGDSGFVDQTASWLEFKSIFLTQYRKFAKHHIIYINGFRTRRDWVCRLSLCIPPKYLYSHFDFINNIKPTSQHKTASQWSNRDGIALCCTVNRFFCNNNNNPYTKEAQFSYLCSDPVHDWSAALYYVHQHIKMMKKYFKDTLKTELTHFYGYSDRGEFSCSGFIVGLAKIKKQENLEEIFWAFTCPEHGKSKCDGCGSGIKCCVKSGVKSGDLTYNPSVEPYEQSIIELLYEKLVNDDKIIYKRYFRIPPNVIYHCKQKEFCKPIPDINDYFEYNIKSPTQIWRRHLDCKCICCISSNFVGCENVAITGRWEICRLPNNFIKINAPIWIKSVALRNNLISFGPLKKNGTY